MEIWVTLTFIISTFEATLHLHIDEYCKLHSSILPEKQLRCTDVDLNYFLEFNIILNRTHWLKCENCTLNVLNETIFNIPLMTNISFLELPHCRICALRKFAFSKCPVLKYLNLRNNSINIMDAMSFRGIKKLVYLDLSYNFIENLTNNLFFELGELDVLNLNNNHIHLIQTEAFAGLVHLKYLYLNHNFLYKLAKNMFKHLTSLKILYLENNKIGEIDSNAFISLNNLNFLYINNNCISTLVQYNFRGLINLLDLQLRSNKLGEIQTSSFNGLMKIKSLYLGDNKISFVQPYGFIGLETLELLELVENKFVFVNFCDYFSHMVNLKYLWLRKNYINNFTLPYKYKIHNSLINLDISDNNLSSLNYQLLYNYMPNIKEIFVTNNSWQCDFFIYMYNFLEEKNVSVCTGDNCDSNFTKIYINDICYVSQSTDLDGTTDFSLDCTSVVHSNVLILIIILFTFLNGILRMS